jgi:hypothetical protein
MIFPEIAESEIKVKEIMLDALKQKKSELQPFLDAIQIEIRSLEEDIKMLEDRLLEKE